MNNVNILGSKIVDHKFFFPLVTILTFLIYIPLLNSIPFGDDFVYIFNNGHILNAPHPFVYWNYGAEEFKSWPLSFSFIWTLYKIFGENFLLYRLTNLVLHCLNAFLFYKISSVNFPKISKYLYLIFMIHPMVVENIYWIFQIKTLLALFFLLLTILQLQKFNGKDSYINYFNGIFFFLASLLAKSTAILFPFSLFFFFKKQYKLKKVLLLIPFFLISSILGIESLKGVSSFKGEQKRIQNYHRDYFKKKKDFLTNNKVTLSNKNLTKAKTIYVKKFDINKYKNTLMAYIQSIINNEAILIKSTIVASSLAFYLKAMFGLTINQIVYQDLNFSNISSFILPLLLLISLFYLIKLEKQYYKSLMIGFLLFLPISGLLYVPYMQYSYVADHWFYSSLPFLLLVILHKLYLSNKFAFKTVIPLSLLGIFLIQTFSYTTRLSNTKNYFYNELSRHDGRSQIIHEYLIELEKKDKNYKQALKLSIELFTYSTSKKNMIIENILILAKKLRKIEIYSKFLEKKSILYFKNGSILQAKDILLQIPKTQRSSHFIFLSNLYDHAKKSVFKNSLEQLNSILVE